MGFPLQKMIKRIGMQCLKSMRRYKKQTLIYSNFKSVGITPEKMYHIQLLNYACIFIVKIKSPHVVIVPI